MRNFNDSVSGVFDISGVSDVITTLQSGHLMIVLSDILSHSTSTWDFNGSVSGVSDIVTALQCWVLMIVSVVYLTVTTLQCGILVSRHNLSLTAHVTSPFIGFTNNRHDTMKRGKNLL